MSDWNLIAIVLVLHVLAILYASSEPPWLVATWRQIVRPFRWIEQKVTRR